MKNLAIKNLKNDGACAEGIDWVKAYTGNDIYGDMATYKPDWVLWCARREYDVPAKLFAECARKNPAYALEFAEANKYMTPELFAKLKAEWEAELAKRKAEEEEEND